MITEFEMDETISFPALLSDKFLDGYHIILAPLYPNWIILNDDEYKIFTSLHKGATIREALENFYTDYCADEDKCLKIVTGLLKQISEVNFFADTLIAKEEPIEKIVKKVHIGTTNGCNMRCSHCYMMAGTSPLEIVDLEKVLRIVKGLNNAYGKLEVIVSGGEPLTYKNIFSLLKQIKNNYVILFTNGSLITNDNIDIIAECCDEVQISFEGISKNCYGKVRDVEKYEKVSHALELLKEHQIKIVLAVTVLPSTMYDIRDNLIGFVRSLDYTNLEVRINDEIELSGNALTMDLSSLNKSESKNIVINIVRKLVQIGCSVQKNDIRNTRFTNCGIGTSVIINYDGKIYPCHKFSDYSLPDSANVNDIIKQFNSLNTNTSNDYMEKCLNCELRYICSGGCRIDNYVKTGQMTTAICDNQFKNNQLLRLLNDYRMYREKAE